MRNTTHSANGTSFHDHTVSATLEQLIQVCGQPHAWGSADEKSQYDWYMETEDGKVFTIYDWKEYREIDEDEVIQWHIGAHDSYTAACGQRELEKALSQLP